MSSTKSVIAIAASIALLFVIAFGQTQKPSPSRHQRPFQTDDLPIVVSGGSLHVGAKPGTNWQEEPKSEHWLLYESGSLSQRHVTTYDIVYVKDGKLILLDKKSFPTTAVSITMHYCNDGGKCDDVFLQTDGQGKNLYYFSSVKDKPTNKRSHVLRHSQEDWILENITIKGEKEPFICGEQGECILHVHYVTP